MLRSTNGLDSSLLGDGCDVRCRVALKLNHRRNDSSRAQDKADTPTGHRVSLRERSGDQHVLFCARHRSNRERMPFVQEPAITLVGHEPDATVRCKTVDLLELRPI